MQLVNFFLINFAFSGKKAACVAGASSSEIESRDILFGIWAPLEQRARPSRVVTKINAIKMIELANNKLLAE